jgi:uncharacterized protein (TIGR03437 family)
MMTRGLVLVLLCNFSLWAQFDRMVTTDDGSTLLFQSQWRLAGSNDTNRPKIFRWDSKGFALVYSAPDAPLLSPPSASSPFLSGDGKVSGYTVYPGCSGSTCGTVQYSPVLNGATAPSGLPPSPSVQISRSGRYFAEGSSGVDLTTGVAQTAPGGIPVGGRFGISNNGALLMLTLHSLFPVGSFVDLTLSTHPDTLITSTSIVAEAAVSASENRVIYSKGQQLYAYDFGSGQSTLLATNTAANLTYDQFQPSISNDGSRVLYRQYRPDASGWDAVVKDLNAGTTTVLAQVLSSNSNLVISGDGKTAWLHRIDGALVRLAIDTLQSTIIPGRHAWMTAQDGAPVGGSYHRIYGGGFAPDDTSGVPAGLSVDVDGLPFPVLSARTTELDLQIPWGSPPSGQFLMTLHNSSSLFESLLLLAFSAGAPTFERSGTANDIQRDIVVAHQDFHGLVTAADPALPNEVVHAYMTGLGGTQPQPLTGAPASGLEYADRPMCWLGAPGLQQQSAAVLFAGLAPGFIGIYQVDIQIPAGFPATVAELGCVNQSGGTVSGDTGIIFTGKG